MSAPVRRLAILQTQSDAGPGHLVEWARDHEVELDIVDVHGAPELPQPEHYDGAVALGSDASWAGARRPGWMDRELEWLGRADAAGVPVLGICFGAQALATLHGGAVTRLERPEVGWLQLDVEAQGSIASGPWLSWHEDGISLPPGGREIARSPLAVHAFDIGRNLGIQFHPEAGIELVRAWIDSHDGRDLGTQVESAGALLATTIEQETQARMRAFALFDHFAERMRR